MWDTIFVSVTRIPCCLASWSEWGEVQPTDVLLIWIDRVHSWGRSFCTWFWFFHPKTNVCTLITCHTGEAYGRDLQTLLYKGAGTHALICHCQAISFVSPVKNKTKQKQNTHTPNKHKLWFFTCLFVSLSWPALQMTLNNWYYPQCWSFLLNCGSCLSYVMICAQHRKSWSGEVCSLSGREGAGPRH